MTIESVVDWYGKNVNYKLTKAFLNFLINIGIIKKDIDIQLLNSFLLEVYDDDFIKENGKFKIKENRIPVIEKYKDEKKVDAKPPVKKEEKSKGKVKEIKVTRTHVEKETKQTRKKFRIESLGGKRLKLVKL